jgi:spectinomycin phosphotransferase
MLERPDLSDEAVRTCLRDIYGIHAADIEFLPLGYDYNAGVYRVRDDTGQDYFLKARRDAVYEPGIHVARALKARGIRQVVAPLPTLTGALCGYAESFALLLYPYIEGRSGMEAGLNDAQWVEYGAVLRRIHDTHLPDDLTAALRRESYTPQEQWLRVLRQIHVQVPQQAYRDPLQQQLAAFWRDHQAEIGHIIAQADRLSQHMRQRSLDFVLCHADIHTNNLLLTPQGDLFVVDWDQPMLAPKERDLLFIMDKGIGFGPNAREEALFFQGYGPAQIDLPALAYYRYEWLAQDVGSFAEVVFLRADMGEETRQDAARLFMAQFDTGNLAGIARLLDHQIH